MNSDVRVRILQLLKSSQKREQRLKVLQYELLHHSNITGDEMIARMIFDSGQEVTCNTDLFTNKNLCITLNYQELAEKVHPEATREIITELAKLEDEQNRLQYYVSLLDNRQAQVIRRAYFDGCPWSQVAAEMGIVCRTAHKIKHVKRSALVICGAWRLPS
ncbi:MAG: hypothetical protein K2N78_13040 [Oscillospiraceae bacterium]|nr:hypothetical protein [Oscillospiraceae bacterium]